MASGLIVARLIELKTDRGIVGNRRWFSSNDMDLIIWTDEGRSITAFELYYDKNVNEHVLVWREGSGFSHLAVDDGEQKPVLNYKEAPILISDGVLDANRIRRLFERMHEHLPAELAKAVRDELSGLNADTRVS